MSKKIFYCSNLAYYAKSLNRSEPETMISLSSDEGGTEGEFAIRWIKLGTDLLYPRLEAFSDSWKVLSEMPELIDLLRQLDNKDISQKELNIMLLNLGYRDNTAYDYPKDENKPESQRDNLETAKKDLTKELNKVIKKLEAIND